MTTRKTPGKPPARTPAKRKPKTAESETAPVDTVAAAVETVVVEVSDDAVPVVSSDRMVVFFLDGQHYAFPIDRVQEIQQIVAFTDVPDDRGVVLGMVTLRGSVVPLLDLRALVGLPARPFTLETPMIICRHAGSLVAIIVDEVEDVAMLSAGCLQRPSKLHALADRMLGVCRMDAGLVFLLDLDMLLPHGEILPATPAAGGAS